MVMDRLKLNNPLFLNMCLYGVINIKRKFRDKRTAF
jgi:hypothetical protein